MLPMNAELGFTGAPLLARPPRPGGPLYLPTVFLSLPFWPMMTQPLTALPELSPQPEKEAQVHLFAGGHQVNVHNIRFFKRAFKPASNLLFHERKLKFLVLRI